MEKNDLTIILPVHNEYSTITNVVQAWQNVIKKNKLRAAIIICEDGSTDGTRRLLQKIAGPSVHVRSSPLRLGYQRAIMGGIQAAKTPYILHVDSDGQYKPSEFVRLWKLRSSSNVLIGKRTPRNDPASRKFFSTLFMMWFTLLFPNSRTDPSSPFVLYPASLIRPHTESLTYLQEGFWWGFSALCIKRGIPVQEVAVHHLPRTSGSTKVYAPIRIPFIALRNGIGLLRLWWAT